MYSTFNRWCLHISRMHSALHLPTYVLCQFHMYANCCNIIWLPLSKQLSSCMYACTPVSLSPWCIFYAVSLLFVPNVSYILVSQRMSSMICELSLKGNVWFHSIRSHPMRIHHPVLWKEVPSMKRPKRSPWNLPIHCYIHPHHRHMGRNIRLSVKGASKMG